MLLAFVPAAPEVLLFLRFSRVCTYSSSKLKITVWDANQDYQLKIISLFEIGLENRNMILYWKFRCLDTSKVDYLQKLTGSGLSCTRTRKVQKRVFRGPQRAHQTRTIIILEPTNHYLQSSYLHLVMNYFLPFLFWNSENDNWFLTYQLLWSCTVGPSTYVSEWWQFNLK